jgi:predicted GIY-YIG superfamily endonuclease
VLIFSQAFESRADAMALETKLKSFKNKDYLLVWIEQQNNPSA